MVNDDVGSHRPQVVGDVRRGDDGAALTLQCLEVDLSFCKGSGLGLQQGDIEIGGEAQRVGEPAASIKAFSCRSDGVVSPPGFDTRISAAPINKEVSFT